MKLFYVECKDEKTYLDSPPFDSLYVVAEDFQMAHDLALKEFSEGLNGLKLRISVLKELDTRVIVQHP